MASYDCRGKNRLWSVRFSILKNNVEITKRLSGYKTKKECQQAYIDFMNEYNKEIQQEQSDADLTFIQLYNEYGEFIRQRNKPSTHYDFVSKTKLHVYPYFESYKVKDITPKIILDWQNTLTGYSYQYKCHLRNSLSGLLSYAEKYYNIPNQLKKVDNFRNLEFKKEMKVWNVEQFNKVMENIDESDKVYKCFYYALFFTGTRKGEMLAVTDDDWDYNAKTLRINKSISKKVTGASWLVTTPKNNSSNRTISVPDFILDKIKEITKYRKDNNIAGNMTFYGTAPLPESNICRKLRQASQKAGIPVIRIHDFRHSHASFLISQGVSIVTVAKRLGHSNTQQTFNTYAHMMPSDEEKLLNVINTSVK